MKKSFYIFIAVFLLIVVGYSAYHLTQKPEQQQNEQKNPIVYTGTIYTFKTADKNLTVQYSEHGSFAKVTYSGSEYELPIAVSASGARYANKDESVVFWEHQREAILEVNGKTIVDGAKLIENTTTTNQSGFSLEESKWHWKETKYVNGKTVTPNTPEAFLLYFMKDSRFSSKTDCNNVMGSFTAKDGNLSFGQMASTKMACPDKKTQEEVYTTMLSQVQKMKINSSEDSLELELPESKGTMLFIRFLE